MHEHDADPLLFLQIELLPQGFGVQGSCGETMAVKQCLFTIDISDGQNETKLNFYLVNYRTLKATRICERSHGLS